MVTGSSPKSLRTLHKTCQHSVHWQARVKHVQIVTSPLLSQLVDSADEAKTVPTAYTNCRFHCERKIRSCHSILILLSPSQHRHSTSSWNEDTISSIMEMTRLKSTLLSLQAMEIQLTRGDPGEFLGAARARRRLLSCRSAAASGFDLAILP